MELEKLIQQKILATELEPIAWDKTRVWQNIRRGGASKPRFAFYYSAASLIIAVLLILYFGLRNEQGELSSKPRTLAPITLADSAGNTREKTNPVATSTDPDEFKSRIKTKKSLVTASKKEVQEIIVQSADTAVREDLAEIHPNTDPEILLDTSRQVNGHREQRVVQAIVGFIPTQKQSIAVLKIKKIRLRLRDNEKMLEGLPKESNHQALTARIN